MLGGDLGDIEGFPGELRDEAWVDPRCAGAGFDFLGSAVGRDDLAQRIGVGLVGGVVLGGQCGLGVLLADVARQRGGGRYQFVGVIEARIDQAVDECAGIGDGNLEKCCDVVDVDAQVAVQAHRERIFWGVGGEPLAGGGEQVGGEDGCFAGLAGVFVEDFQRRHDRPSGIVAHAAVEVCPLLVRGGGFPCGGVPLFGELVGDRATVGCAGLAFLFPPPGFGCRDLFVVAVLGDFFGVDPGEAVDGSVAADVVVVEGVEVPAQLVTFSRWPAVAL